MLAGFQQGNGDRHEYIGSIRRRLGLEWACQFFAFFIIRDQNCFIAGIRLIAQPQREMHGSGIGQKIDLWIPCPNGSGSPR